METGTDVSGRGGDVVGRRVSEIDVETQKRIDGAIEALPERARILVIDDSSQMRSYINAILQDEYELLFAGGAKEALRVLEEERPDLIISDSIMPGMHGQELCRHLKTRPGNVARLPFILIADPTELHSEIQELAAGADDYVVKPFHPPELVLRVRNTDTHRRHEQALRELYQAHYADLREARAFQKSLLSQPPKNGPARIAVEYRPLDNVGGDIYDFCILPSGDLRVFLGDTSGHGIKAALRTMVIHSQYDALKYSGDPAQVLARLNNLLIDRFPRRSDAKSGSRIQLAAMCLDFHLKESGGLDVVFSSGTDLPAWKVGDDGATAQRVPGIPLGCIAEYPYHLGTFSLRRSERLVVFTDGVSDQKNPKGVRLAESPSLVEVVLETKNAESLSGTLRRLMSSVQRFAAGSSQVDDLTVLCIESAQKDFSSV